MDERDWATSKGVSIRPMEGEPGRGGNGYRDNLKDPPKGGPQSNP